MGVPPIIRLLQNFQAVFIIFCVILSFLLANSMMSYMVSLDHNGLMIYFIKNCVLEHKWPKSGLVE